MYKNNKGSVSAAVIIIVILIILGGIYLFTGGNPSYNQEPDVNVNVNNPPVNQAGQATASTGAANPITQTTAVLTGDINPNGAQTSYWYEYGIASTLGSFSSPQLAGGGFATFSAPSVISGLTPNTTYYYRLAAENQFGKVYGATMSFKTLANPSGSTTAPVPAPSAFTRPAVDTRAATAVTSTTATLNATVNPFGSNTTYWFEYGPTFDFGNITPFAAGGTGRVGASATANVSGLLPNTTYYYRAIAQNAFGTNIGSIAIFTTAPTTPLSPPLGRVPTVITSAATSIGESSATLNGSVNPEGVATTYHFEYGKSTPFGVFTLDRKTATKSAGNGTASVKFSENIAVLDSDSTYYYQLVAENQYGTSRGAIFSFTTD